MAASNRLVSKNLELDNDLLLFFINFESKLTVFIFKSTTISSMEVLQVSNNGLTGGKILVTAYEQPWTMANAYKLFVFFVSKVASPSRGYEPYSNTVIMSYV